MATVGTVSATGNKDIDGLLSGYRWNGVLTYSFTDSASDYSAGYGYGEPTAAGFAQISASQQAVMHTAMAQVAQYTNLTIQFAGSDTADIRIAQSSKANPTAYAYYPGSNEGGDIWFGTSYNYRDPKLGNYSYLTHIHELGHSLGLKHSQEAEGVANTAVPTGHDALEYTVMSYRSYVGGPTTGYTNETYGFPTTFMMNDIRALQEMYGADFGTNSGNTVYTWSATTGETFINGAGQGQPGGAGAPAAANVIFMTVWDGGGNDTYDFSNYVTGLTVNLNPGVSSVASATQLAYLGGGKSASGNVYNAMLYNNDARSYIENAVGGSGNDTLTGNATANRLDGGGGNDTLTGSAGNDVFVFRTGYGADIITDYSVGFDDIDLSGLTGFDSFAEVMAAGSQAGLNALFSFSMGLTLTLQNVALSALSMADFIFGAAAPSTPNEAPTSIALDNLTVSENVAGGLVGNLVVSDTDDTAFTFTLSDTRFQVVGAPGAYMLALKAGTVLDYETQPSIPLSVTAKDSSGLAVTQQFTIAVGDAAGATITGTEAADVINGTRSVTGQAKATNEGDTINAGGGNDTVSGLAGHDVINGGAGGDALYGDAGDDRINGGLGADRNVGGAGNDVFIITGTEAQGDSFAGEAGTDSIEVAGNDAATLSRFSATLSGVEAWVGNGQAVLGTAGADSLEFSGLQSVSGLAYIDTGAGNDLVAGTRWADDLRGGAGNDTLYGNDGNDRLTGGIGVDLLDGGAGDDVFVFGGSNALSDTMRGGAGFDAVEIVGAQAVTLTRFDAGASSIETWQGNNAAVTGSVGADYFDFSRLQSVSGLTYIDAGAGADRIWGTAFADDLRGDAGNDVIYGNDGNDRIAGGAGVDTLNGGAGDDVFVFGGADALSDSTLGGVGTDTFEIAGSASVTLTRFDAGGCSIEVWQGNGAAVLGTAGADVLDFSRLTAASGITYFDAGAGYDKLVGTSGADDLRGGAGNDTVSGGDGDDRIDGGAGTDTLNGGAGNDTFAFGGSDALYDVMSGGAGTDTVEITGTASAVLAKFDSVVSSIEAWHGNDAGLMGSTGADYFDFSAITDVSRLPFVDTGAGNDRLTGTALADDLRGGAGDDILKGGAGDDILRGGDGKDRFIFDAGFDHDTVVGFQGGAALGDVLAFSRTVFASLDDLLAASHQVGNDVVITTSDLDTLTLQSTQLTSLHANDFAFT
jgi:serralysin